MQAAKAAGMAVDIYYIPCKNINSSSTYTALAKFSSSLFSKIWINVESNPSSQSCGWRDDSCGFLTQLADDLKSNLSKIVGITSNGRIWQNIMDDIYNCGGSSSLPLTYFSDDNSSSIKDFTPFGNWIKPGMKIFSSS